MLLAKVFLNDGRTKDDLLLLVRLRSALLLGRNMRLATRLCVAMRICLTLLHILGLGTLMPRVSSPTWLIMCDFGLFTILAASIWT